jgi:hypothetical protein
MFMTVDIRKHRHLIFNGELPSGFKLTRAWGQGDRYFFVVAGSLDNTLNTISPVVVLLDSGELVISMGGWHSKEVALKHAEKGEYFYIGEGIVHSGIGKC